MVLSGIDERNRRRARLVTEVSAPRGYGVIAGRSVDGRTIARRIGYD